MRYVRSRLAWVLCECRGHQQADEGRQEHTLRHGARGQPTAEKCRVQRATRRASRWREQVGLAPPGDTALYGACVKGVKRAPRSTLVRDDTGPLSALTVGAAADRLMHCHGILTSARGIQHW